MIPIQKPSLVPRSHLRRWFAWTPLWPRSTTSRLRAAAAASMGPATMWCWWPRMRRPRDICWEVSGSDSAQNVGKIYILGSKKHHKMITWLKIFWWLFMATLSYFTWKSRCEAKSSGFGRCVWKQKTGGLVWCFKPLFLGTRRELMRMYIYICFEEFQLRKGSLLEMIITIKYI